MPNSQPTTPSLSDEDWETLLSSIKGDWCTPILGPEVSKGTLAARAQVATASASEFVFPLDRSDELYQVAQYMSVMKGNPMQWRRPLAQRLRDLLAGGPAVAPDGPHAALAKLPLSIYVTTNIDTSMTRALENANRAVKNALCPWWSDDAARRETTLRNSDPDPKAATPVVFYLFGNVDNPDSLVLSEDDHLDFLIRTATPPKSLNDFDLSVLPNKLVDRLKRNYLLFLGYRLNDFDFRILLHSLKAILAQNPTTSNPLIAVQIEPGNAPAGAAERIEALRLYLQRNCIRFKIKVVWETCEEFISAMADRYVQFTTAQPVRPTPAVMAAGS